MRFLPVFLDLQSGVVLLVGAGDLVRAKLRLLASAGARVRWFATDGNHDLAGLDATDAARIEPASGDPLTADLSGVIAVLCAGAGDIGVAMSARAKAVGLPVNVMDDLAHSTFIFPAIVDRGDVVVAVGTGGTSPVVARRVRERIEAVLPARIGDLAAFIGSFRKSMHARIPEFPLRRRFWERVIDGPIGALVLAGRKDEAEKALNDIADPSAFAGASKDGKAEGRVTLVGAGPGDPDLLTIKALRALQDADVVFYDELVSPEILDRIRRDASRIPVGRRVGKPGIGQDAINKLLIDAAKAGQRAVRLKGGDPFIFGRGGEEIEVLRAAGVAYSVVPGITAGLGAAAQFEAPLTFRHEALRITFLTAHKAKDAETVDWSVLTRQEDDHRGLYGHDRGAVGPCRATRCRTIAANPVGIFARVTRPDAQAVVGTLENLPALVEKIDGGPAVLIIGDVVAHSAPWRQSNLNQVISKLLDAAE
ncbi:siroheme synthase CysG [Bradyrhizobium sp. RDT10]